MPSALRLVNEEMAKFITQTPFLVAHTRKDGECPLDKNAGESFLKATLDEVRLYHAENFTRSILTRFDLDDAMHFHEAVLSREMTGNMAYERQRDHAAHTLNNYLLGCYLFEKSEMLKAAVHEAVAARRPISPGSLRSRFGNVWIWASLLHDIGYLLEGNVPRVSPDVQHAAVAAGARVVQDYFDHRFWFEVNACSIDLRHTLCERAAAPVTVPRIDGSSMASVATSLMRMPITEALRDEVRAELGAPIDLPYDAFKLWQQHFAMYHPRGGNAPMAKRIRQVRSWFESTLWDGYPGEGFRILDHGVCSGLMQLQFSTFYFTMLANARREPTAKDWLKSEKARADVKMSRWWENVVWGTGAAAVHNIVQVALKNQGAVPKTPAYRYPKATRLTLDEDPIAYLGLLVDLLQDWDRYSVRRGAYVLSRGRSASKIPLQSSDVRMGLDKKSGRVVFDLGNNGAAERMREELELFLTNWKALVEIRPLS